MGDMETTFVGDIPIGPARNYGIIDTPRALDDTHAPPALGDMHAGIYAGRRTVK
jgi:hypothetical protein